MFIAKQNDIIIQCATTRKALQELLKNIPNVTIEETDTKYQMYQGSVLTVDEVTQKEQEALAQLKMTPRDFLLAITEMGVEWSSIKNLMAANPQVEIELQFCNHVYRGNPLLDQLCGNFNITTEQLDTLFKTKGS